MLSLVSSYLQCSTKVARSPVSGLKPCEIIMVLCILDAFFASKSTILYLSNLFIVVKQGRHLCQYQIKVANQSHILSCREFSRIIHIVSDVALLLREALCWDEIGHNMVNDQDYLCDRFVAQFCRL